MISSLTLVAALAAGKPFLTTGTYRYVATMAGHTAGTSTLVVSQSNGTTTVAEDSSGSLGAMQLAGKATLQLDAALAPTEYSGVYRSGKQTFSVTAALAGSSATVISSIAGGQPQTLGTLPNTTHFAVVEPGLLAGIFALPAQLELWKTQGVTVVEPALSRAQVLQAAPASPSPRPNAVPSGDLAIAVTAPIAFTIWYDPATFVPDEIDVPSQDATVVRVRQP